jgi:predicted ATPase
LWGIAVYIQRVVLENVRGFRRLDFSFERPEGGYAGWTVLTGDNGSGKTALLKAIALAVVGPDFGRALQPSFRGWIREGADRGEVSVWIEPSDGDSFTTGRRPKSLLSKLDLVRNGGPEVSMRPGRTKKKGPLNGPWAENTAGWFTVGYGPFRRLYGASPEAQRLMSGPGRVARFATMFKEDATLLECEIWLRDLKHKQLEGKDEGKVLEQVERLLNDDFLQNNIQVDKVDSDGLWLRDASGAVLPLQEMSDGYRAALALMIDIIRHLSAVHPGNQIVQEVKGKIVVPFPGVVLVDEVDAHLHPEWQRRIGWWLKERFPLIQFVVTTHSPLICQAADPHGIFKLPAPGTETGPFQVEEAVRLQIVSSRPDTILLTPAFGLPATRSPEAERRRIAFARLKEKQRAVGLTREEDHQLSLAELFISHGDRD